ncbi:MAG: RDD family protein [Bacteroidales bacterium]|nr:RDD family protein [Bacteroidales bacterium]
MNRQERLKFCKVCKKQSYDQLKGIICSLTDDLASFENFCEYYEEDAILVVENKKKEDESDLDVNMASQGKRLANRLLDYVFILVLALVFGVILGLIGVFFNFPDVFNEDLNLLQRYFLGFMLSSVYYVVLEATTGRTIAKFITGTKVVNKDGKKPGFTEILGRTLCRAIPFEAFSFLSTSYGLHDRLSNTKVVNVK